MTSPSHPPARANAPTPLVNPPADEPARPGRPASRPAPLAARPALASRPFVLERGPGRGEGHLWRARLQHTRIVPLYSVLDFPARRLRGLCLPYFGGMTLSALLEVLGGCPPGQRSGRAVL